MHPQATGTDILITVMGMGMGTESATLATAMPLRVMLAPPSETGPITSMERVIRMDDLITLGRLGTGGVTTTIATGCTATML